MTTIAELERMNAAADRAAFDAIKHMLATVEDPRDYAIWLITTYPPLVRAIRDAVPGQGRAERGYWIVQDEKMRPFLVRLGLVPVRERYLSSYGASVRKWLVGEGDEEL
jgi:hypothetical protein